MPLPLVSICCITYNHAPFIRDALEGFLVQKTGFPFEILIHDDASTDGTADIIRAYVDEHPDLIFPVYQAENQYSKGVRGIMARFNFPRARGRYIATCEGDDYWTDPLKLQKQVDFLEKNTDYVVCYHDAVVVDENNGIVQDSKLGLQAKRDYSQDDLRKAHKILVQTMCFRNVIRDWPHEFHDAFGGDKILTSLLGAWGKGKYLDHVSPSAWRRHAGGINSGENDTDRQFHQHLSTRIALYKYHLRIGEFRYADYFLFEKILPLLEDKKRAMR